jgi:hypothetical protein
LVVWRLQGVLLADHVFFVIVSEPWSWHDVGSDGHVGAARWPGLDSSSETVVVSVLLEGVDLLEPLLLKEFVLDSLPVLLHDFIFEVLGLHKSFW